MRIRDFKEFQKMRLASRVKRLQKLIRLDAPAGIIAMEVWLLVEAAIGYCGPEVHVLKGLEKSLYEHMRISLGFCHKCKGNPGRLSTPEEYRSHMCAACLQEIRGFEAEESKKGRKKK